MEAYTLERNSGWVFCKMGPSWTPWSISADIMMAAAFPPGIPRLSRGTMEPPVAALLAVSEAATPRSSPLP